MSSFWLITNVFLDVFPWIFLLYMPFKDRLRFSVITTGVLNYIALTIYLLIFKKITTAEFYNLDVMFSYRVVQIFVVLTLVIFLVDDYIEKSLFVYGLLLPISVVILVWASHINNHKAVGDLFGYGSFKNYNISNMFSFYVHVMEEIYSSCCKN